MECFNVRKSWKTNGFYFHRGSSDFRVGVKTGSFPGGWVVAVLTQWKCCTWPYAHVWCVKRWSIEIFLIFSTSCYLLSTVNENRMENANLATDRNTRLGVRFDIRFPPWGANANSHQKTTNTKKKKWKLSLASEGKPRDRSRGVYLLPRVV